MRQTAWVARIACAVAATAVAVAGLTVAGVLSPAEAASPVRVMALGDSITGSPGCWRSILWNRLQSTGHTNVDMVGTLDNSGSCGRTFDGDNEGHGGYLAINIANQRLLPGWLSASRPDIVMMHLGTNDAWGSRGTAAILNAYGTLVDQMRASNPRMKILVAEITAMNPAGCSACSGNVVDLNRAIPGWVRAKTTPASPITVVDQWSGYNTATDTVDGVHPNDSGNQKISDRWYPALTNALSGSGQAHDPAPPVPTTGTNRIVGAASGRCIDLPAYSTTNGQQVALWDCSGGANQSWVRTAAGELRGYGNKCLDAQGWGTAPGTAAVVWDCNGGANQKWTFNANGSIANRNAPALCLDARSAATEAGTKIILWTCTGAGNQRWSA